MNCQIIYGIRLVVKKVWDLEKFKISDFLSIYLELAKNSKNLRLKSKV